MSRTLSALLLALACTAAAQMREVAPPTTDAPVFNPGMGLYHQHAPIGLPDDHWSHQIANIAYFRLDWASVNPEEGVYDFDGVIGKQYEHWYVQRGRRIAFRVMSQSMHSRRPFATPEFVFRKGVPGVTHRSLYGVDQTDPVFWDSRYLDEQDRFLEALGKWCAPRREGIEFIDLGGIGEWGEMHLARWTPQQLRDTGFTHTRYVLAYRRMIDSYRRHLPGIRLFLNVGGQDNHTINDYAALNGIHFRQDGLMSSGASYNCGEWLYRPYAEKGILCNYEFHADYSGMQRRGWSLPKSIDVVLSQPISYLNTNLGIYGKDTASEVQEQLFRAARKIGYRLRPKTVRFFGDVTNGVAKTLPVTSVWTNDGLAAPSVSAALRWSLHDASGKAVCDTLSFSRLPTTAWKPGADVDVVSDIELPADLPEGTYRLKLRMCLPENDQTIQLALDGRDADGRYDIGEVTVRKPTRPLPETILHSAFSSADDLWQPTIDSFRAELAPGLGPDGSSCMRISGAMRQNAWNFVHRALAADWRPWSMYRLSALVNVRTLSPMPKHGCYLKFGINDQNGKWLSNVTGGSYDLGKGGWQRLEVIMRTDDQPVTISAALETASFSLRLDDIDILVADVRLELIAEP